METGDKYFSFQGGVGAGEGIETSSSALERLYASLHCANKARRFMC